MCEGCPIQTLAELYRGQTTELRIWNEGDGKPSQVMLSVMIPGERFAVHDSTCRGAVAQMCREMDAANRVGSCADTRAFARAEIVE